MYTLAILIAIWVASVIARPNIVFIIADDLGWADAGFHSNGQIISPNIDSMYNNSVFLNHYYVQAVCSPTRTAFMTGRYPIRSGMQDFVVQHPCPYGLNLNETTLPQILQSEGYDSHAVGKWHLGFYKWAYTPTFRGFNSYLGFYTGGQYYYSHMSGSGYDFRYDKQPNCGRECTQLLPEMKGKYSTEVFTSRAVDIIHEHDTTNPLFLYVAYQAVHDPSEVPQPYLDLYNGKISDNQRKRFAAMVTCMDEGIGNITKALKDKGIFDDTLIVFSTDNGGPINEPGCNKCGDAIGANNYPLRAGKHSLYEGGSRGIAVMSGLNLPHHTYDGLMHVSDWLPTLAHVAGVNITGRTFPLDGMDMWDIINNNRTSPRKNVLYNIEMSNREGPRAAYRDTEWKLIIGPGGPPYTIKPTPNYEPCEEIKQILREMKFLVDGPIELFNLIQDPSEKTNVVAEYEPIALDLIKKIQSYHKEMAPAYDPYYVDPLAEQSFVNGTWMPWGD